MNYFHFNNTIYEIGDIIEKQYKLFEDIINNYKEITSLNVNSIVYMLDNEKDEYYENNNFCYIVEPIGQVFKGIMDYSPIMCQSFIEEGDIDNHLPYSEEQIKEIIYSFANAYNNSDISKEKLLKKYKVPIDDKIEYICNKCKVLKILR